MIDKTVFFSIVLGHCYCAFEKRFYTAERQFDQTTQNLRLKSYLSKNTVCGNSFPV